MAGGKERILKRRIKSVQSTKKITRAMELIAASRIVKAQARVRAARPYSEQITQVIKNLAAGGAGGSSPLLNARPEIRTVAYLVLTADRGLCGAYNSSVIRAAERSIAAHREAGREIFLVTVGRKAESYFRYREYDIGASFAGFTESPSYEQARAIAETVAGRFDAGEIDQVQIVSTRFLSAGSQVVAENTLMPLDAGAIGLAAPAAATGDTHAAAAVVSSAAGAHEASGSAAGYEFEPSPEEILGRLLPRYVEARVFAALLDAAASEHAARQRAMKAATDNAEELIKSLSRIMNRARQDTITTEIMEIVGGAEALRQAGALVQDDLLVDQIISVDAFPSRI
jgi:F-type H+-transporting ATPase subunit gamma